MRPPKRHRAGERSRSRARRRARTDKGRSRPTLTVLPRAHYTAASVEAEGRPVQYVHLYLPCARRRRTASPELVRFALDGSPPEVGGTAPRVGRLILTAHSGGGKALLESSSTMTRTRCTCSTRSTGPRCAAEWARKHIRQDRARWPGGDRPGTTCDPRRRPARLLPRPHPGGTRPYSLPATRGDLAELGPEVGEPLPRRGSRHDHFQIPRRYGWRVLADASADVPDAYVEQTGREAGARGRARGGLSNEGRVRRARVGGRRARGRGRATADRPARAAVRGAARGAVRAGRELGSTDADEPEIERAFRDRRRGPSHEDLAPVARPRTDIALVDETADDLKRSQEAFEAEDLVDE